MRAQQPATAKLQTFKLALGFAGSVLLLAGVCAPSVTVISQATIHPLLAGSGDHKDLQPKGETLNYWQFTDLRPVLEGFARALPGSNPSLSLALRIRVFPWPAVLLMILASVAAVLSWTRRYNWLYFTGCASLAVLIWGLIISRMWFQLAETPWAGTSAQYSWGWLVLFGGVVLTLSAALCNSIETLRHKLNRGANESPERNAT